MVKLLEQQNIPYFPWNPGCLIGIRDPYNGLLSADPSRRVVAIILCKIQTCRKIQNPKSKIQNPKSKIQDPKSKIQNPRSKIQNPKSKIQNPKSKRPRLGPPHKERILRQSKIQNPRSKIQNPNGRVWGRHIKNGYYDNPKSKIQNPKSKIQNPRSKIQNPKSKIQNPKSKIQTKKWILEFGFGWPVWGGYVANPLVWMGWPPKSGVVGRGPSS